MSVVMKGTDLYKKAQALLENPNAKDPYPDFEKSFHWFNLLLNGGYETKDENLGAIYFAIGAVCLKRSHNILALLCFQKANEIDQNFLEAMNNIAYIYKKMNMEQEAKYYFKRVLDLSLEKDDKRPECLKATADYHANYGSMLVARGTPQEALAVFDRGLTFDANHRMLKYNRSLALLELGDYANGFPDMDYGDRIERCEKRNYGHPDLPWWDGTPGKRLVVIGEQGIGDEIMYATMLPKLFRDCGVVLDVHPRLIELFRRTFPNIDIYGTRKDESDLWGKRYQFDAKVMLGSLPKFYCKKKEDFLTFPYLEADPVLIEKYRQKLNAMGNMPKVGISWRGGSHLTEGNARHIPLEKWVEILKLPCDFISLQYDRGIESMVAEFEKTHDVSVNHWPDTLVDYDETAALVKNLDLVISVPQSVIHLSGALGTIALQLTPKKAMWQMGVYGENMPWYDCVASIWQEKEDEWDDVMKKVKDELCSLLQMNTSD